MVINRQFHTFVTHLHNISRTDLHNKISTRGSAIAKRWPVNFGRTQLLTYFT